MGTGSRTGCLTISTGIERDAKNGREEGFAAV